MGLRSIWLRLRRPLSIGFRSVARWLRGGKGMQGQVPTLTERLRCACEEADLLAWYFARHCPGDADEMASTAYSELIAALAAARDNETEESYRALMEAYHQLAWFTFSTYEVHGRSIQDTLRKPQGRFGRLTDRRTRPVVLGAAFFMLALALQVLDVWTKSVLGESGAAGEADSSERLCATLLASCIPLLSPVAWGALGACAALAKRISDRLSAMSYEDNRMRALTARIFLGAALELILDVLIFVEGDGTAGGSASEIGFGPIAAAFLAGLFVQHIYGALETFMSRISRAISPDGQRNPAPLPPRPLAGGSLDAANGPPQPRAGGRNPVPTREGS